MFIRCLKLSLLALIISGLCSVEASDDSMNVNMVNLSNAWECKFPVDISGTRPNGNFYSCQEGGCGSEPFKDYNNPSSYVDIEDFIVDFGTKTVSFKETIRPSLSSSGREEITTLTRSSRFADVSISNLHEYRRGQDQVVTILFRTYNEPLEGDVLQIFDPSPKNHVLSYGFRVNTISFYDGGIKVAWNYISPSKNEKRSMDSVSVFGECRPVQSDIAPGG